MSDNQPKSALTFDEYQAFTRTTAVYPKAVEAVYLTLGLVGEVGEMAEGVLRQLQARGQGEGLARTPSAGILYALQQVVNGAAEAQRWKKFLRDRTGPDVGAAVAWAAGPIDLPPAGELGDCLYYLARTADAMGVSFESVFTGNVAKLTRRRDTGTIHGSGEDRGSTPPTGGVSG